MKKVLVIDSDAGSSLVARSLLAPSFELELCPSVATALAAWQGRPFDAVLLDIGPDTLGPHADAVDSLARTLHGPAIVAALPELDAQAVVGLVRAGASSFIVKPYEPELLARTLRAAIAQRIPLRQELPLSSSPHSETQREYESCRVEAPHEYSGRRDTLRDGAKTAYGADKNLCSSLPRLLGTSRAITELLRTAELYAKHDMPVLIVGESGTGKELAAEEIHARSVRKRKPFLAINCASIPEQLAESELFGTAKGAFTGAVERPGLFEEAQGGTLFLDEIGELPLSVQPKLLRAIENKSGTRIGSSKTRFYDVRVLSATNAPLLDDPRAFRPELLNRLNVLTLKMPALRNRPEDIRLLAHAFLAEVAPEKAYDESALLALEAWHWPGNVRELKNLINRVAVLSAERTLILGEDIESHRNGSCGLGQHSLLR
jgi:DNA-binding NtrC family response regulator